MWPNVIKTVMPSVVRIKSQTQSGADVVGAGFVVGDKGWVATCWHVVHPEGGPSAQITLQYSDGQVVSARVLKDEPDKDLTLLSSPRTGLQGRVTTTPFSEVEVGEPAAFIGFPLGSSVWTVHTGVISAKARFAFPDFPQLMSPIETFQLDASVHFGNSGGPLIRADGTVIGYVDAKVTYETQIGKALRQYMPSRRSRVIIGGVDPIELVYNTVKALEESRQMGIGYAFSIDYVKAHIGAV